MDPSPESIGQGVALFIDKGILGVLCVLFMYTTWYMWRAKEVMAKEKDTLIAQLYEKRIEEKNAIADLARQNERTIDSLARSLNVRMPV